MQTTIKIKKIYVNPGTTKQGKPYILHKFLAMDRCYYATFKVDSVVSSIIEGDSVKLECEPNGKENTTLHASLKSQDQG